MGVELLREAVRLGAELPVSVAKEIAASENVLATLRELNPAQRREPILSLFRRWNTAAHESFRTALLTAALAEEHRRQQESIELVWTGPDSHVIPVRQTAQVLLDLIRRARQRLLIVSYAVFRIPQIREALVNAAGRGVRIRVVLDLMTSTEVEGYNPLIAIGDEVASRSEVVYWPKEQRIADAGGKRGLLHVKCVVADGERLFISSANLTDQAFRLNMELGVMINGTRQAAEVEDHFAELLARGVLKRV